MGQIASPVGMEKRGYQGGLGLLLTPAGTDDRGHPFAATRRRAMLGSGPFGPWQPHRRALASMVDSPAVREVRDES